GLLMIANLTIAKKLNPRLQFDPKNDFTPINFVASAPLMLTASTVGTGVSNAGGFFAAARKAGNKWNSGSPGIGSIGGHIGMELLKARTEISAIHVPYPDNQKVIAAMLAGEIQMSMQQIGLAMPHVQSGKLQAIGVTSSARSELAPGIPSLA